MAQGETCRARLKSGGELRVKDIQELTGISREKARDRILAHNEGLLKDSGLLTPLTAAEKVRKPRKNPNFSLIGDAKKSRKRLEDIKGPTECELKYCC